MLIIEQLAGGLASARGRLSVAPATVPAVESTKAHELIDGYGDWGEATFDGATVVRFRDGRIAHLREYRCTEPPYRWTPPG